MHGQQNVKFRIYLIWSFT